MNEEFENIWSAVEEDPAKAANLKLRSELMSALCDFLEAEQLTQKEAARRLGVTQPRISDLKRGRISVFGIESLVAMLAHAGLRVKLRIGKAA